MTQPSADSLKDKKEDEEFLISASMSYVFIVSFTSLSALNRHLDRRISHFNIPNEWRIEPERIIIDIMEWWLAF